MLQFVVLLCVCAMVCVHEVDEIINCGVLMFLLVIRVVFIIRSVDAGFLNMLNVSVLCKFVVVKSR
jgi:hypothetical protein